MPQRSRIISWPFVLLAVALLSVLFLSGGQAATPEKPFADLQEGDSLTAAWLMGTINTIYNWSQVASSTLDTHATNHANHLAATAAHGATGAVVGTTNAQSLTNKTLDSTNSVVGEAVKSGTVADARIASTICRDSELTTHAGTTATHGVSGAIVGTSDTQTLTNKTLGTTNSVDGGAVKTGTVADARIDAAICRDSELTTHGNLTAAHGATGAVMGTTNTQTVTNKTMDSTNSIDGGAVKTGTVADARIDAAICRDSELTTHGNLTAAHGATGAVVGTTNSQTLTNKTLTSPTINDGTTNLDGGQFIAPQTTTPSQFAEGSFSWDTDNDLLTIGTGNGSPGYERKTMIDTNSTQDVYGKTFKSTCNWNGSAVGVEYGGTGANTAAGARGQLGLGTAATKNIGTVADTVAAGNDSRFGQVKTAAPETPVDGDIWVE